VKKMPCQDYLPLVEKLADGEATPAERREAEAHLGACQDCREHFRFLEALPTAARKMSPGEPPEIYWEALPGKIMARVGQLEEREKHSPRRSHFGLFSASGLRWAGALAAAVVAAVVGLRVLDVPFTGERTSQDALQRPSAAQVGESAESGKVDEPMVRDLLRLEDQPAGEASSERSFPEPQEGQSEGGERRAAPSQPAGQIVSAPSPAAPEPRGSAGVEERDSPSRPEAFADDDNEELQKTQAVGETGQVTLDQAESHEPDGEGAARERDRFVAGAQPQDARDQPPSATTPPSGLQAARTRPDQPDQKAGSMLSTTAPTGSTRSAEEHYRTLIERYPLGSAVSAGAVKELMANEGASNDKARECADWRQFVNEHGGSEQETSARYRLALCSIALYELQSLDDNRRQAVTDGQSFLALEPSGDRADAIRRRLEGIER
jgi:hypothetical protein